MIREWDGGGWDAVLSLLIEIRLVAKQTYNYLKAQMETIYTVGHSTHNIEFFINLLNQFHINCLIDIRTSPYSRIAPQFNKEQISNSLKSQNIIYAHFDKEFGARHTKLSLLDENKKVDFEKVRATSEFKSGIDRLRDALKLNYVIAIMCSESNPFDCHRFSMVSYQLAKEDFNVIHILRDGTVLSNASLEEQLLKKYQKKLPQTTLFESVTREEQLEIAYRLRGQEVAYAPNNQQSKKEFGGGDEHD